LQLRNAAHCMHCLGTSPASDRPCPISPVQVMRILTALDRIAGLGIAPVERGGVSISLFVRLGCHPHNNHTHARFRREGRLENNLVIVDGQYYAGPAPDIFLRRLVRGRVSKMEAFGNVGATLPQPTSRDGEVWSTKGKSRCLELWKLSSVANAGALRPQCRAPNSLIRILSA
jgi:hypothetical protein